MNVEMQLNFTTTLTSFIFNWKLVSFYILNPLIL